MLCLFIAVAGFSLTATASFVFPALSLRPPLRLSNWLLPEVRRESGSDFKSAQVPKLRWLQACPDRREVPQRTPSDELPALPEIVAVKKWLWTMGLV